MISVQVLKLLLQKEVNTLKGEILEVYNPSLAYQLLKILDPQMNPTEE